MHTAGNPVFILDSGGKQVYDVTVLHRIVQLRQITLPTIL